MCYVNKIRYQTIVTNEINKKERKKELKGERKS